MAARTSRTREKDWKARFLDALAETGMVTEACDRAGVPRSSIYERRAEDEQFAQAWDDVVERATEELEREAVRRAKDGSDLLMIFLLKSRRPEKYRDHHRVEHVGKDGAPLAVEVNLDEDARKALGDVLRRRPATRR